MTPSQTRPGLPTKNRSRSRSKPVCVSVRKKRTVNRSPRTDPDQEGHTAHYIKRRGGSIRDLICDLSVLAIARRGRRVQIGSMNEFFTVLLTWLGTQDVAMQVGGSRIYR